MLQEAKLKSKVAKCHPDKKLFAKELCRSCYEKQLRHNNPAYAERQRNNTRDWIEKNQEKYKQSQKEWRAKQDPDYLRQYKRMKKLETYGLTPDDYDEMLRNQNGLCAICNKSATDKALAVDHCHETGRVRGLLCFICNFGLTWFSENSEMLSRASDYVRK